MLRPTGICRVVSCSLPNSVRMTQTDLSLGFFRTISTCRDSLKPPKLPGDKCQLSRGSFREVGVMELGHYRAACDLPSVWARRVNVFINWMHSDERKHVLVDALNDGLESVEVGSLGGVFSPASLHRRHQLFTTAAVSVLLGLAQCWVDERRSERYRALPVLHQLVNLWQPTVITHVYSYRAVRTRTPPPRLRSKGSTMTATNRDDQRHNLVKFVQRCRELGHFFKVRR